MKRTPFDKIVQKYYGIDICYYKVVGYNRLRDEYFSVFSVITIKST